MIWWWDRFLPSETAIYLSSLNSIHCWVLLFSSIILSSALIFRQFRPHENKKEIASSRIFSLWNLLEHQWKEIENHRLKYSTVVQNHSKSLILQQLYMRHFTRCGKSSGFYAIAEKNVSVFKWSILDCWVDFETSKVGKWQVKLIVSIWHPSRPKSVWSNFIIHWNELRRIFCCQLPRWTFFVSWERLLELFFCVSTLFISRDSWCRFWRHFLKIKGHFNLHKVWKIGFFFKLDFFEWFFWSVYYYFVTKLIFSMMIEVKKSDMEVKYEVGRDHTR